MMLLRWDLIFFKISCQKNNFKNLNKFLNFLDFISIVGRIFDFKYVSYNKSPNKTPNFKI